MVDVHLAFNNLLDLGVEIRLAPNLNRVDITVSKYWDAVRHSQRFNVDFLNSKAWLGDVVSAGKELANPLRSK